MELMQTFGFHHSINIVRLEQCGFFNSEQVSIVQWIGNQAHGRQSLSTDTLDLSFGLPFTEDKKIVLVFIGGLTKSEAELLGSMSLSSDTVHIWTTTSMEYLDEIIPDPWEDLLFLSP
jgi:hypothetical protein